VFSKELAEVYAQTFVEIGVKKAMVVHSYEGLDEISTAGPVTS
jgi:anthranilate phosphoribosyltransferase